MQDLKDQASGKKPTTNLSYTQRNASGRLVNTINRGKKSDKTIVADVYADTVAQVSRRFLELLNIVTPVKTGELNGGWTFSEGSVSGRKHKGKTVLPEEDAIINFKAKRAIQLNISNAVEHLKYVNYGTATIEPRLFINIAKNQLRRECIEAGIDIEFSGSI